MTDKELKYIVTIAECKSISKAATRLFISQPSLSQVLANVEKELGRKLFERSNYGLFLNEYGKKYVEAAKDIIGLYRNMEQELYNLNDLNSGKISFGLPKALSPYLLPLILSKFKEKYPNFIIEYFELFSSEVEQMVLSGRVDFGILHIEKPSMEMSYELLQKEEIYLVVHDSHPLNKGYQKNNGIYPLVNLQDFAKEDFILVLPGTKVRSVCDMILKKAGINPVVRYATREIETAKQMVAAGLGVTFIPKCYMNLYSGEQGLRYYRLSSRLYATWNLAIAYPKKKCFSTADKVFIEVLKTELSNLNG